MLILDEIVTTPWTRIRIIESDTLYISTMSDYILPPMHWKNPPERRLDEKPLNRIVGCQDVPGFDAVAKGEKVGHLWGGVMKGELGMYSISYIHWKLLGIRWWLQSFFKCFVSTRGDDPIWLIFFNWVETCWNHQLDQHVPQKGAISKRKCTGSLPSTIFQGTWYFFGGEYW